MHELPPHLDRVGDDLVRAARTAHNPRRSRIGRVALGVGIAAVCTGGAALAITGTNPVDWLRGGDSTREVRIAADPSARVTGDFPEAVICSGSQDDASCRPVPGYTCTTDAAGGTSCSGPAYRLAAGEWQLHKFAEVAAPRVYSAADIHRALKGRDPGAPLFPDAPPELRGVTAAEVGALADRMPAAFWDGVNRLMSVQGGGGSADDPARPGNELVPPPGVARFVTCTDDGGLRCRPIAPGATLAVGAPIYGRDSDATWRSVPMARGDVGDDDQLVRQVFGHRLSRDEALVLAGLTMLPAPNVAPRDSDTTGG